MLSVVTDKSQLLRTVPGTEEALDKYLFNKRRKKEDRWMDEFYMRLKFYFQVLNTFSVL